MATHILKLNFIPYNKQALRPCDSTRFYAKPVHCLPVQQQVESGIMCESCCGRGWLLCDFCKGQKTNVKAENNRIYRRCPACKAIGCVLCTKCKVFRCVTFPDYSDGD
ncbi:hypothetical protein ACJIZ3_004307 [Penstemon smallii]|uniref:Uncharacterized protein n=1 Tax=Penstemon smallii TaxID=265156 RepID=A0ABD3S1U6_9LAMI